METNGVLIQHSAGWRTKQKLEGGKKKGAEHKGSLTRIWSQRSMEARREQGGDVQLLQQACIVVEWVVYQVEGWWIDSWLLHSSCMNVSVMKEWDL